MYKVLCLTDHSKHSNQNSVYALLRGMFAHPDTISIDVASRGSSVNDDFFKQLDFNSLFGRNVNSDFEYDLTGFYWTNDLVSLDIEEYDIIFFRLPSPLSEDLYQALASDYGHKVLINDPKGMIDCSSKSILAQFRDSCPPLKLCRSIDDIRSFCVEHKSIVLKPMRGYGGQGIIKVDINDFEKEEASIRAVLLEEKEEGLLAMKFLKNVVNGDKRLIVVGGEIVASSLRVPAEGSWLCNVAMGGSSHYSVPTENEQRIVSRLAPFLSKKGILIAGIDTLEDDNGERVLSEINVLSIGGFPQAEEQTGQPIILNTINKIYEYVRSEANG